MRREGWSEARERVTNTKYVKLTIISSFKFIISDIPMVPIY